MKFIILTIFPQLFNGFWDHGIMRRAVQTDIISETVLNIRDFTSDKHNTTDDRPFGGGCGMVMTPKPLTQAIHAAKKKTPLSKVVLLSPQGVVFNQSIANKMAKEEGLVFLCGRYEGIDERIRERYVDYEVSIGDYVMTGGELAAMVIMDTVTRLIPGSLGNEDSAQCDSFSNGLLDYEHYTRPREFEGVSVPEVLLSGDHKKIENWRQENAMMHTLVKRPDLIKKNLLNAEDMAILKKWRNQIESILNAQSVRRSDS